MKGSVAIALLWLLPSLAATLDDPDVDDAPDCCALNQDGRFLSNLTFIGAPHNFHQGYVAADPTHKNHCRFAVVLGANSPKRSQQGWFAFQCDKNPQISVAVAWTPKDCLAYKINSVPNMCFGATSIFPKKSGRERIGIAHNLARYSAARFPSSISVHTTTCMPYYTLIHMVAAAELHSNTSTPVTSDIRPKWGTNFAALFHDPEVTIPNIRRFGFPDRCTSKVEKKVEQLCGASGTSTVHEGVPILLRE